MTSTATIPTPAGPFTVVVSDDAVVASGWSADADALLAVIGAARLPSVAAELDAGTLARRRDLGPFTRAVRDYHDGDLAAIDAVPVAQSSGPFTNRAWDELRAIPAGESRTYSQLAASSGRPAAIRAAGTACATNRAALFVPCHRALRSDGTLGGFAYGLDVKRWLLAHEAQAASAARAA
ncbi:methylated-DNA--[protein]-cysteine S-methyltransferase [Conexibacter woesei]|uniref:Methylated-DNA/protein-cysteinemethyltransferase n=1 Tax=Conexibacter woesei (strain DSM 14684 / CCUG 47730 / CIP 108061 / JCM 11494 / NBRC 100937 / ID131577) TaxID=469383 RepID=D3FCN0_CONWI|nr:methylated-DNA--[protein]-cysteine S-methyltransferase [Conexibacter woesei]ADB49503.1 methylated-DNA/protein-cysteinemethyltransferase [Conexibacter woesei DSM 14684]